MEKSDKITRFCSEIANGMERENLKNLTFSSFPACEIQKVRGTLKRISGAVVLQLEYFLSEGRVRHENVSADALEDAVLRVLNEGAKNVQLVSTDVTATLLVSKKGAVNLSVKKNRSAAERLSFVNENNREKSRIFDGSERFLTELGVSDKEGRVHDKKQSKFRQINRFAEQVRDILKYLPSSGTLHVYDLCCGKSYLSFAVYDYLTRKVHRDVKMICADLKASVMESCKEVAKKLGYTGMEFICADVNTLEAKFEPDLVISLHACDTATDMVLDFAVRNGAKVILSTPCCQHEMFNIMSSPELDFISKYSILKQKIASAATDALRLAKLESEGYKTDAMTPKNVLLRGIKTGRGKDDEKSKRARAAYERSYKFMTGVDISSDRT